MRERENAGLEAATPVSVPPVGRGEKKDVAQKPSPGADVRLRIDVEWADIACATGHAFAVGHYIGVVPQNAELALDRELSQGAGEDARILKNLTRRGAIRGALGDVMFFPWGTEKQVVIAGMGRLGTFKEPQLKILAASLARTVGRLMPGRTLCTVLIGAGLGNLKVTESISGLLSGMAEALAADPTLHIGTLRLVERNLDRAYEIHEALTKTAPQVAKDCGISLWVDPEVVEDDNRGGTIPVPYGFSMMLASVAQACHPETVSPLKSSADALIDDLPPSLRAGVRAALAHLGRQPNRKRLGLAFRLGQDEPQGDTTAADRVSFTHDGTALHSAAITNLTTVTARALDIRPAWVDRLASDLRAPAGSVAGSQGLKAFRTLVHPELREKLWLLAPLVLELDRTMATIPWELLHNGDATAPPLAVHRPVARQLRTAYSPRAVDAVLTRKWRALVIGDPEGNLPAARTEARDVAATLKSQGLEVESRIGPPDVLGLGSEPGIDPADLLEVLQLLQSGDYDLVHYCGHAHFDVEHPDRSGWKFKDDDVLTPSKLEGVERPPRLIVANACVSSALSTAGAAAPAGGSSNAAAAAVIAKDARIVAGLADEFFRRGVGDFIGTAWEVPESAAPLFARHLYSALFRNWESRSNLTPMGEAVQEARKALFDRRGEFGEHASVWAAYQHYGDPTRTLAD